MGAASSASQAVDGTTDIRNVVIFIDGQSGTSKIQELLDGRWTRTEKPMSWNGIDLRW